MDISKTPLGHDFKLVAVNWIILDSVETMTEVHTYTVKTVLSNVSELQFNSHVENITQRTHRISFTH